MKNRHYSIKKCYLFKSHFKSYNHRAHKYIYTVNAMVYRNSNVILSEIAAREAEIDVINYYTNKYTLDEGKVM